MMSTFLIISQQFQFFYEKACICMGKNVFPGQKAQHANFNSIQNCHTVQSYSCKLTLLPTLQLATSTFAWVVWLCLHQSINPPLWHLCLSGPFMAFLFNQAGSTISLSHFFSMRVWWLRTMESESEWIITRLMTQGSALVPEAFFQRRGFLL